MLDGRGNSFIVTVFCMAWVHAGSAQVPYVCVQGLELCLIVCISLV